MTKFVLMVVFGFMFSANAVDQDYLRQILHRYEELSGKQVEMVDDLDRFVCQINMDLQDENLTSKQMEETLRAENIGLYEITTNRLVATWIEPNIDTARWHLDQYGKTKTTPPIALFGFEEIREYQANVPELRKLKELFDQTREVKKSIAMQDIEYRDELNSYESLPVKTMKEFREHQAVIVPVIERLKRENETYRIAREDNSESLFRLNMATLEYIINDYEKRGKCVPTRWMNKPPKKREEQKAVTHQHSAGCRH